MADHVNYQASNQEGKMFESLCKIIDVLKNIDMPFESRIHAVVGLLSAAFRRPDAVSARIFLDQTEWATPEFEEAIHRISVPVVVQGEKRGLIEVGYPRKIQKPGGENTAFIRAEHELLQATAGLLAVILQKREAQEKKTNLEGQLRHADRLAKLGQIVAGVAHELNNPLGEILGFSQLASNFPDLPEQVYVDLEKIVKSSLYAREIVKKLMFFTRQMPPQQAKIDLNKMVKEWLYLLETRCDKSRIAVDLELEEGLPEMTGDASQLNQVIVNLLVNAIQAMPDGGKLTVETCSTLDHVTLAVSDTGKGMSEETRKQIFMPFFTTKDVDQGTGLGLSVVHGIISAHHGTIEAESREGEGSRFLVKFPR